MDNLATLNELRAFLRVPVPVSEPATPTDDDTAMSLALGAASSAIRRACNRTFEVTAQSGVARYFTAVWNVDHLTMTVPIDDTFATFDDVTVEYDAASEGTYTESITTDVRMVPMNAGSKDRPYTGLLLARGTYVPTSEWAVQVTTDWGWEAVPDTIKTACLIQAARIYKRRDAPFGIAGSPDMGSEMRLLSQLDPDVQVMVADYRRWTP